jgi:hypothetical protein
MSTALLIRGHREDMIDWLVDLDNRFGKFPEIQKIKERKFHGSITINFMDGMPQNYDLKLHRRAEEYSTSMKGEE